MIRRAQPEDLDAVREIFREYANSLPPGHLCFTRFEQELQLLQETYSAILLAFEGGLLAGCIAMRPLSAKACEMKRLYVRGPWRGTGLGRRLVERIVEVARTEGCESILLDTMPEMVAAFALYERMGFEKVPAYGGQGPEVVCMKLVLN